MVVQSHELSRKTGLRLLVCTQAVDSHERALGFFVGWLNEFAHHFTRTEVICLTKGDYTLPGNVAVHSLGKEAGASRLRYVLSFYRYVWTLRHSYDAVFVHMNEEYVLLGGLLWRLLGKKIIFWRNHKMGSWRTRLACTLAHVVCYTSPLAYVAPLPRSRQMPIGIDTRQFHLSAQPAPFDTALFLGRLDPVKKPEVFLQALDLVARKGLRLQADGYGEPTDPKSPHVAALQALIALLEERGMLRWHSGVAHSETPAIYAAHSIYINLTPSGSFDKTIGEAMASGCIVVAANQAIRGVVPDALLVNPDSFQDVARGIEAALMLQETDREETVRRSTAFITEHHSLQALVGELAKLAR